MTIFFITVFAIYFLFLLLLIVGWNWTSEDHPQNSVADIHLISVVVPFRNEKNHLPVLIETLRKQNYPKEKFEVTLIDDHSDDDSLQIAKHLTADFSNFKIISADSHGKKLAIAQAIESSSGEIVVTTDADCEVPVEWLKSINQQFSDQSMKLVVGSVHVKAGSTFLSKLQAVEFFSLIGSAAATLALGFPTMCNGANLSYRKEVFKEVNGFQGNEQIASGDDEFLMRKVVNRFGAKSVKFLKDPSTSVGTNPQASMKDFFQQRIRWAAKWRYNSSWISKAMAIFVLVFQISWLLTLVTLFFQPPNNTIMGVLVVKVLTEGFFLFQVSRFMKQKFYWSALLVLQIIYPLYVIAIGVLSNLIQVSWKGRSSLQSIN